MKAAPTPMKLTRRSSWSSPKTTSRGASDGRRPRRDFIDEDDVEFALSGTDEGYSAAPIKWSAQTGSIVASGA